MTEALNPEPLLRALHEAGVRHIIIGGFAVNAHGVIRPSRDLDIVPDPDPDNLRRLTRLFADIDARHANFRLETNLGDLDIMHWVAGIEAEPAYTARAAHALKAELEGVPLRVCGLDDLIAMKRAAGRPRDLDDLQRLGAS